MSILRKYSVGVLLHDFLGLPGVFFYHLLKAKLLIRLLNEFNHIKQWAATNGLVINSNKTKEIVFRQPRVSCFHLPAAIDDIEQVDCCKLLGVMFQNNCKMDSRVQYILSQRAQRIYLLKLLQRLGMPRNLLAVVTYSIVISRVLYALPAWAGFLSVELTNKINSFLNVCCSLDILVIVF